MKRTPYLVYFVLYCEELVSSSHHLSSSLNLKSSSFLELEGQIILKSIHITGYFCWLRGLCILLDIPAQILDFLAVGFHFRPPVGAAGVTSRPENFILEGA